MLSRENQDVSKILLYYHTSSKSLNSYRESIASNKVNDPNYIGFTKKELIEYFNNHFEELEKNISFNILSTLEASFMVDYLFRTKRKLKDDVSRKFRDLYKLKEDNVSLEHEILTIWKSEHPSFKSVISDFVGALKYRHWLAHGRYWKPKLGRNYDVSTISTISERVYTNLPLYENA